MTFGEKFNRRRFLQGGAACLGLALYQPRAALLLGVLSETVEVRTPLGFLRGAKENGVVSFKGVPYVGRVDGERRFRQAPALQPWSGTRDALQLGPPSWQPGKTYFGIGEPTPQENCLVLTVWTRGLDRERRPVMFHSHGGGFVVGSSGSPLQDGSNLAREYDVVVREQQPPARPSGVFVSRGTRRRRVRDFRNQGLLDIADALKWVNANIESLGGDPDNVMIFGESGG